MRTPASSRGDGTHCSLSGLAMSATGALVVEELRYECVEIFIQVSGCTHAYQYEEVLEFLGIWLVLIAVLGHYSAASPPPRRALRWLLYALPALSMILLLLPFFFSMLEVRYLGQTTETEYETDLRLQAYRVDLHESRLAVKIFMSSNSWHNFTKLGYSVHLVDQVSRESVAGADDAEHRRHGWRIFLKDRNTNYSPTILVDIPEGAPTNRAYWVVLTLWREEGERYIRQRILASDRRLLDDTQLMLWETVLPRSAPAQSSVPLAEFDHGLTLDSMPIPQIAISGESMSITVAWRNSETGNEDYIQFLHFVHVETGVQWGHDQQPLGARLPTRLWYSGLVDSETWQVPLPADSRARDATMSSPVSTGSATRSAFPRPTPTGAPFQDARIPLGSLIIE